MLSLVSCGCRLASSSWLHNNFCSMLTAANTISRTKLFTATTSTTHVGATVSPVLSRKPFSIGCSHFRTHSNRNKQVRSDIWTNRPTPSSSHLESVNNIHNRGEHRYVISGSSRIHIYRAYCDSPRNRTHFVHFSWEKAYMSSHIKLNLSEAHFVWYPWETSSSVNEVLGERNGHWIMSCAWTTTRGRVSASGAVARSCARRMCANSPDVHTRGSSRQSSEDGTVSRDMADREP